jgi:hypothetical protein
LKTPLKNPRSHSSPESTLKLPQPVEELAEDLLLLLDELPPPIPLAMYLQSGPQFASPVSHCSLPTLMPSPQIAVQVLGVPVQDQPDSVRHTSEQPSPRAVLPSSHVSLPLIKPSPQIGVHVLEKPRLPVQRHPLSVVHDAEHPSPAVPLPSSHCSPACRVPSPHVAPQDAVGEMVMLVGALLHALTFDCTNVLLVVGLNVPEGT